MSIEMINEIDISINDLKLLRKYIIKKKLNKKALLIPIYISTRMEQIKTKLIYRYKKGG